MGRKKSYDREELIAKAVELFRDNGYASTSTQMLVESLGVNRNSLYSEFGSKQALFDAAIERYDGTVLDRNFGPLEVSGAGLHEIRALLRFFAEAGTGVASGRGCLLCNTAVEFGPQDPSGAEFVQRYFHRISSAFINALSNAKESGDLAAGIDPRSEANLFTAGVLGIFVMIRAQAEPELIRGSCRIYEERLEAVSQ